MYAFSYERMPINKFTSQNSFLDKEEFWISWQATFFSLFKANWSLYSIRKDTSNHVISVKRNMEISMFVFITVDSNDKHFIMNIITNK